MTAVHLGDHGAGRRQHRVGNRLWRRLRDLGQHSQLLVNMSGMALAGWAALALQHAVWSRVSLRRARAMTRPKRML